MNITKITENVTEDTTLKEEKNIMEVITLSIYIPNILQIK